jgi:hypothetical protein
MERQGKLCGRFLIAAVIAAAGGCSTYETETEVPVVMKIRCDRLESRAYDPEEDLISDVSLLIFDERGSAEACLWSDEGRSIFETRLLTGHNYTICACANFGYRIQADDISETADIRYHMAYPDEYRNGIPMFAIEEVNLSKDDREITITLERLMAKISLQMDRSRLSDDVRMYVRAARIGNCPRSVSVFTESRVRNEDDCFPSGFVRKDFETDMLNTGSDKGLSGSIHLYMLENMQGEMETDIYEDSEKIFGKADSRRKTCSYIELEIEYMSDEFYSTGKGLIYRFYLGEDRNNLDVERNCHYHITVTPEDDGLSDDGWRVDKSSLNDYGPVSFNQYPSDYIVGDIGDKIHIGCDISPWNTPFDVGIEYMEDDKAVGIYDYEIDDDGHGATLTLTGPGRGLIYMEAGEPINDAALFIIEVNLPKVSGSI